MLNTNKLAVLALLVATPVWADDIRCTSTIGAVTVDSNVIVPAGRSCTLDGTRVKGNVELRDRAQILIRNGADVDGNVQTDGANRVRILNSEIGGNIQLSGIHFDQASQVLHSYIGGTIDWNGNSSVVQIQYNHVDSDIKVNQNGGLASIYDNVVGGNLQCQSNQPAPRGARNIVHGNKEDQCRRF